MKIDVTHRSGNRMRYGTHVPKEILVRCMKFRTAGDDAIIDPESGEIVPFNMITLVSQVKRKRVVRPLYPDEKILAEAIATRRRLERIDETAAQRQKTRSSKKKKK